MYHAGSDQPSGSHSGADRSDECQAPLLQTGSAQAASLLQQDHSGVDRVASLLQQDHSGVDQVASLLQQDQPSGSHSGADCSDECQALRQSE